MGGVFHVGPFEVAAAAAVIENQLGQLGLLGKVEGRGEGVANSLTGCLPCGHSRLDPSLARCLASWMVWV